MDIPVAERGGCRNNMGTDTAMTGCETSGIINFYKPEGCTSRDLVDRVEDRFPGVTAGHGGTLDRLAVGVLPVLVNEATKLVPYLQDQSKDYRVIGRFDRVSDTIDRDGEVEGVTIEYVPHASEIRNSLSEYVGAIEQIPPRYSALKKDGKRLSEWMDEGKPVNPDPRTVVCEQITIESYSFPEIVLSITCGKGFYVRSLIRDLGLEINGRGGLVIELTRTRYGPFSVEDAVSPDAPDWEDGFSDPVELFQTAPDDRVQCDEEQLWNIVHGQNIRRETHSGDRAIALDKQGRLHAILEAQTRDGTPEWHPCRVLNRGTVK